ncbi:MMPL family transporter [Corynebacterium dentalis]|uniref:MMPL family transporter n=1 Tax=Corynebacterium dentalis TaxID=2014528 RepID=UPI00289DCBD9|nr:MMPL family transporter [Corynebacterium dentalis]
MAKFLFRLARWCYTHSKRVIAVWLLLLVGVGAAALTFQKGFNDIFEISDMPSTKATELLMEKFPGTENPAAAAGVNVVFEAPEGQRLDQPEYMQAMDQTVESIRDNVPDLGDDLQLNNPVTMNEQLRDQLTKQLTDQGLPAETAEADAENLRTFSEDGRYGIASFEYDVYLPADVSDEDRQAVNDAIQISRDAGLEVEVGGAGFGDPIAVEPISEVVGLIVALIILFIMFRSLLTSSFPLITAVVGVGLGALMTVGATAFMPLNSMTPTLGIMLGLAVGIDYALFIMARFRDELREGRDRLDAIGLAVGTAGSAVVFAGLTVIIALVGMRLANIPFLSYMGYAAAATVLISVLVALTFLPAILGLAGERVFKSDANSALSHSAEQAEDADTGAMAVPPQPQRDSWGTKWVKLVQRAPGISFAIVVAILVSLTLPVMDLQLSLPSDKTSVVDSTQRKSAEMTEEGFGPGRNAPILVVVNADDVQPDSPALETLVSAQGEGDRTQAAQRASFLYTVERMGANVDVRHAQLVGQSEDGSAAQILVTPEWGPTDERTVQLIHALRAQQAEIESETGVEMGITGLTPIQQDVTDSLAKAMPIYLALVVGLALVLLMMVFRSLAVPLIAASGFLLSVGAAFGVTVLVWQEGLWGLWDSPGPLISFMPIFLIGVTFGLAMDYQVFIVSRMRERFVQQRNRLRNGGEWNSKDSLVEDSVIGGFGLGARVVTVAALIMIGVFASFVFQPLPFIQIFGFALGAGVLFDAFFIRMTVVPALMILMGRFTWYMPKWLDKLLLTVDVEGAALEKAFESGELGSKKP